MRSLKSLFCSLLLLLLSGSILAAPPVSPSSLPEQVVSDGTTIYLLSSVDKKIFRWSIASKAYLAPLDVGYTSVDGYFAPTKMALSVTQKRLYLGYNSGKVNYISLSGVPLELSFVSFPNEVISLAAAGKYLVVQNGNWWSAAYPNTSIFNAAGAITDSKSLMSFAYSEWSQKSSRLYTLTNSYNLTYLNIDQTSGKFFGSNAPYSNYADYWNNTVIRVASDDSRILAGAGNILNGKDLAIYRSVGATVKDGRWLSSGGVVSISMVGNRTAVQRRDAALNVVEYLSFAGAPIGVYGKDSKMIVVTSQAGTLEFNTYVPSDDTDGDGVTNLLDKFPLDKAASVDTDDDGYPDAWNPGSDASKSSTGLALDSFPKDSACYLASQALKGKCNYAATVPSFTPDQILSDGKVVYMLSTANKRVYRWSIATASYLNPFVIGVDQGLGVVAPVSMTISVEQKRLFLRLSNGLIDYIALSGSASEKRFSSVGGYVSNIVSAGKYLLVESYSNDWKHTVLDAAGIQTDAKSIFYAYQITGWDPVGSKMYQQAWPGRVWFETINQTSGKITGEGTSPSYNSNFSYTNARSLEISLDGKKLVDGSGIVYDLPTFSLNKSLPVSVKSAKWLGNSDLVSLTEDGEGTVLQRRDIKFNLVEEKKYIGYPLGVYGTATKMVVVTFKGARLNFYLYTPSNDSDGDGVPNSQDAFPDDPAASKDSDGDGYPDGWNKGFSQANSSSGLVLDAYPADSGCYLLAQGVNGSCDNNLALPNFVPDQTVSDGSTIFFLSGANKRIYRWSINEGKFINPIIVGMKQGITTIVPNKISVSKELKRLYLGYDFGVINYIDLKDLKDLSERPFANTESSVRGLAVVGKYLLAQDDSGAWSTHYIFDQAGTLTDKKDWNYYSREYAWNQQTSRVYFFRDDTSPNDLHYEVIDQATGKITGSGESPYHGAYSITPPIRVSPEGNKVILGSGDIYSAPALTWSGSLGIAIADATWLSDGSLVTVSNIGGNTFIQRISPSGKVLEKRTFDGSPIGIYDANQKFILATIKSGKVTTYTYIPSEDDDGDGVDNHADAFPEDSAASIDSDGDGYPDSWNSGKSQSDSSTGLQLDAYPHDSACFEDSQGAGGVCNYAATVPSFTPDAIVSDGKIIYLLSVANNRVYRWSMETSTYLNPFIVGYKQGTQQISPKVMTLSQTHDRLYLGYETGAIHYVPLSGDSKEVPFANIADAVGGLASVGNYILAQDYSGAWAAHYILDANGSITDYRDWNHYSREYAWDAQNSRVYFFRDGTSPNDLQFEVVDQSTGKITDEGEAPYHGDYLIRPPIRVSNDGNNVLLGSGDIYTGSQLLWGGSLGETPVDAKWLADGGLVVINTNDSSTVLERRTDKLVVEERLTFNGQALGLFGSDTHMIVVTLVNGGVIYTPYSPSSDSDGDGVVNSEDDFPVDPAASLDSDRDGYPDAWNAGKTQSNSTTGLQLDAYPNDSACYLPEHGDGVHCDFSATMPQFTPDQIETDGEVVYLLSKANKKIYRRSIVTGSYLNPLVVGLNQGFNTLSPNKIAISKTHKRIYLGYSNGAIQFISLLGTPKETHFANTAMSVNGLAAVGNFILAQDSSGAWATHYVFDEDGVLTDSKDWNYYSREYAWDAQKSRVYFFRDDTSPNDLHYEVIDQTSGKITSFGETPYHGDYTFYPPIRLAPDASKILLGPGDIYSSSNLTRVAHLSHSFLDAYWGESTLTTIDVSGLLEIWNPVDFSLLDTFRYTGTPLRLVADGDDLILVHLVSGELTYTKILIGDHDHDGLPKWWESKYGLDDSNASDASSDNDADGLDNLNEYKNHTDPTKSDTDEDGISDGLEVNTYHSNPQLTDSDSDGLSDQQELFVYTTNPNLADSDSDGFSDAEEILFYLTNPNSAASVPPALTSFTESFESNSVPVLWANSLGSSAAWYVDSSQAYSGSKSLRSGDIGDNQKSGVHVKSIFAAGTLKFYAKLESEPCCDRLEFFVDGVMKFSTVTSSWAPFSVTLTSGIHDLEWRYVKDVSVSNGGDSVWIDQVTFVAQ